MGISVNFVRSEPNVDGEWEEFFADVRPLTALGNAHYKTAAIVTAPAPDQTGRARKLEGNGPVEPAASRAIVNKHVVLFC